MSEVLYQSIAECHGYSLPEEYRQMNARGFFELDAPAHARDFTTPGRGYLWLNDMEWYSLSKIAEFEFPEEYRPHLQHLIPFGFNAAGDYWCWQTDKSDSRGTRVLLCPHDYELARIYAPNFPSALYRQTLEYACYGTDFGETSGTGRTNRC